jgi:phosphate transport system substrate-binding protein
MKNRRGFITGAVFAFILCLASPPVSAKSELIAAGSGVNLEITRLLAQAFMKEHPDTDIKVPGSIGTKGAIAAVANKAITIGLLSRPLKTSEAAPHLVSQPYARTLLVVGVNPSVIESEISSQELLDIYRGTKMKWKNGRDIVVQIREANDSGFLILEQAIPGFKEACDESRKADKWTVYFTDQDANAALVKTTDALGVTDLGMMLSEKLAIKPLAFNGVAPTLDNLANGTYPLSRTLSLLYRDDALPPEAKAFLDFIHSEAGKTILKEHGYIPT